jgi:hypothetical protein
MQAKKMRTWLFGGGDEPLKKRILTQGPLPFSFPVHAGLLSNCPYRRTRNNGVRASSFQTV